MGICILENVARCLILNISGESEESIVGWNLQLDGAIPEKAPGPKSGQEFWRRSWHSIETTKISVAAERNELVGRNMLHGCQGAFVLIGRAQYHCVLEKCVFWLLFL